MIFLCKLPGTVLNRDYEEPTTTSNGRAGVSAPKRNTNYNSVASAMNGDYSTSIKSNATEETYMTSTLNSNYMDSSSLNNSHDGSSQMSLINGHSSLVGSHTTIAASLNDYPDDYCEDIPQFIEFDSYKLIFQGKIGGVCSYITSNFLTL